MSMAYSEAVSRAYVEGRFPRASSGEREKIIRDWVFKGEQSESIAIDFERRIQPLAGLRVLDAGSGNGGLSIALANHGAQVEGVDIEEELVAIARAEATAQDSSAKFSWYEGTTLPFPDKSFDAAISVSVLEHVTDPIRFLSEILRVLKPGGVFYLAFPNKLYPKETHTGLYGLSYMPLSLGRFYIHCMKRGPLEDQNLHFYFYKDLVNMLRVSTFDGRVWSIRSEHGSSRSTIKRVLKTILRVLGIPRQALLPHIMVVCEAS